MISRTKRAYRGRFAPTPSGPLHLGSLATALASYAEARAAGGAWLLRIDDLDRPRCPPGTDAVILRQLEAHGLVWDGPVRYQSAHVPEYAAALAQLEAAGAVYACTCTRAQLRATARAGVDEPVYAGTCRAGASRAGARACWRLAVAPGELCYDDGWKGRQCRELARDVGDFVVRRADGCHAYQLACAIDEHAQRITEVVRGADLLASTFRQLAVLRALELPPPRYRHLPVLIDARGRKLSKQNHSPPVDAQRAAANLVVCLERLGQRPPAGLATASTAEAVAWAVAHWDAARVPRGAQISA